MEQQYLHRQAAGAHSAAGIGARRVGSYDLERDQATLASNKDDDVDII